MSDGDILHHNFAMSLTAVSVGKKIAEKAPSLRVEYLAEVIKMLPQQERESTVLAALDRATL